MKDRKLTIAIIIVLIISVIGLGIAFAAFSQTLTINGTGTVELSSWSVVFEGADGSNTIGAPTLVGTATEVTHPTIKNNSTKIGNYAVTLKSPGDSVTYNFKIHNKGDYAADLTSLTVAGVNRPGNYVSGENLAKNFNSINWETSRAAYFTEYSFYYTSDNIPVGQLAGRDCLEPGESENVSLRIIYNGADWDTDGTSSLPKTNLTLDNLGITAVYTQSNNGSCAHQSGTSVVDALFENIDSAYYIYEGKTFKGTGVNNLIITEVLIGEAKYSSSTPKCSDGSTPTGPGYALKCPTGTTFVFVDTPAIDMAEAYCTGCRLMTYNEAVTWCGVDKTVTKCYVSNTWWLDTVTTGGLIKQVTGGYISSSSTSGIGSTNSGVYVRPVVSIPSTATMSGSGTQQDPYIISTN